MRHFKVLDKITWFFYVVLFIGVFILAWEYFYPLTIIKPVSIKILNSPVRAGEYLQYQICYVKYRPYPAKVILTLINSTSQTIRISEADAAVGVGCKTNYVRIPQATDEDTDYRLCWEAIYHPTNLSEKRYGIASAPFEILAAPVKEKIITKSKIIVRERIIMQGPKGDKGDPGSPGKNFWGKR